MREETRQFTEEGYKVEVLKARIAKIVVEYEEKIADYEIALQQARQRISELESEGAQPDDQE